MDKLFLSKEKEMKSRLFYIMAIAASIVNVFGCLLNVYLHGFAWPTKICVVCGLIILLISLMGVFSKNKKWAMAGILITVIWIEFPLLYSVYNNVILIYFIVSIMGIVVFFPRRFRVMFSAATIVWDIAFMIFEYMYPKDYEATSEKNMLIFAVCSYLIVAVAVLVLLSAVTRLYEKQRKELAEINEQLYFAATHDSLTKLYNREYLMKNMEKRMQRDGTCFIAVILDIDNFKHLNDTYGHTYGDYVLASFAQIMEKEVEGKGFAARYGGEEFMIILDNVNQEEALQILGNISRNLEDYFQKEKQISVTFSGGLEIYSVEKKIDELIKSADNKLYEAKRNGKNQIIYKSI